MTIKPFAIQGADLTLGGVNLQAGTTGVVIPGVTQATGYKVEEVNDTGDQTHAFAPDSEVVVVDYVLYQTYLNNTGNGEVYASYLAATDGEGYVDGIEVDSPGLYTSQEATDNAANDMYVYIGGGSQSDQPLVPQDWIQIPFRPKMRAGAITTIGGGNANTGNFTFDSDTITNGNGLILVTDRGTLAIGTNMETPGVAGHFHIGFNGSNSYPPSSDLFLGDDYNYVKLPGYELNPADHGVEIGTHNRNGGNSHNWRFGTDGSITFPDSTVQTTAYTGQGGSGYVTTTSGITFVNNDAILSTPGTGTIYTSSLRTGIPSFLVVDETVTDPQHGFDGNGMWFSGGAGLNGYPVRTDVTFSETEQAVVEFDFLYDQGCADQGVCVFLDGDIPDWSWGSNPTCISAKYDCGSPQLDGFVSSIGGNWGSGPLIIGNTYRARFTYNPNITDSVKLETFGTDLTTVIDTLVLQDKLSTGAYRVGFSGDQDSSSGTFKAYFTNLSITPGTYIAVQEWKFGSTGDLTLPTDGNILNRDGDVLLSSKISTPVNINLDGGGASTIYEETSLLFADGGFASTRRSITDPLFDAGANGANRVYGTNDNLINGGGA